MTRTSTASVVAPTDALHLRALEHAQELGLQRQRQLADLVEEQRAAVGRLEVAPACAAIGAGERALLVAEQLASRAASPAARRS